MNIAGDYSRHQEAPSSPVTAPLLQLPTEVLSQITACLGARDLKALRQTTTSMRSPMLTKHLTLAPPVGVLSRWAGNNILPSDEISY